MKIKYIHFSEPEKEKVCDSVVLNKRDAFFRMSLFNEKFSTKPQEEYDKYLLRKMEKDKEKGYILSYEVVA